MGLMDSGGPIFSRKFDVARACWLGGGSLCDWCSLGLLFFLLLYKSQRDERE